MTSGKPHYENVPFEIPESWEWVRLGEISNYGSSIHNNVENIDDRAWILELEDVEKDSGKIIHKVTKKDREISGVRNCFTRGQVLYAKLRTYLNKVLVAPLDGYCTTEIIPFSLYGEISPYYIAHVLRSIYFIDYTTQCCYGCKMPRLGTNDALNGLIPLPPIAEQKRIESEITKCFALLEEVDANKRDLQETIKQVKGKILSFGINGYLVPQDPNDEPAIELLRRMKPDLPPCDTSHYKNLPNNWTICQIKDVYTHTTGKTLKKTDHIGVLRKYITTSNLYWNSFDFTDVRSMFFTDKELDKCTAVKGDLLICNGGDVGRAAIWNFDEPICFQNHISRLRPKHDNIVLNEFCYYLFMYLKEKGLLNGKGVAITSLSGADILSLTIPIPPFEEQKRIVNKIVEIFDEIDSITSEL